MRHVWHAGASALFIAIAIAAASSAQAATP
jgi:hypothetical protein